MDKELLAQLPHDLNAKIADIFSPYVDAGSVAGVVAMIADKDHVLGRSALGYANIEQHRPMQPDALFWVASQTKPVTSAAVMMLVDEGKVNLDDPVAKYIAAFEEMWVIESEETDRRSFIRANVPITIRHLLSHASGLPFRSGIEPLTLDNNPLVTTSLSYAMLPLVTQPGAKFGYSNAGINVAARVIEIVTGQEYSDFLNDRLFSPLNMADTTFWPNTQQLARLAQGYTPSADGTKLVEHTIDQLTYPLDSRTRFPMPAGGLFSTALDMVKFCQIFLNDGQIEGRRYLSSASVAEMSKPQISREDGSSYGLGLDVNTDRLGHGGAYSTGMRIFPAAERISMFMVHHAGFLNDGGQCRTDFENAAATIGR